jgi:hypothetical protein
MGGVLVILYGRAHGDACKTLLTHDIDHKRTSSPMSSHVAKKLMKSDDVRISQM